MRRASVSVVALVALAFFVVASQASAAYNAPKQAKKMSIDMVTAFNQCTAPTLTHRPSLAFPACAPAASTANDPDNIVEYQEGGNNETTYKLQAVEGDVKISVKGKGIVNNGGLYTGDDLSGTATVRLTDNGCGAAFDVDCTVTDFPLPVALTCVKGSCKSQTPSVRTMMPASINPADKMNVDIGQISILDPDGDPFARGGILVK